MVCKCFSSPLEPHSLPCDVGDADSNKICYVVRWTTNRLNIEEWNNITTFIWHILYTRKHLNHKLRKKKDVKSYLEWMVICSAAHTVEVVRTVKMLNDRLLRLIDTFEHLNFALLVLDGVWAGAFWMSPYARGAYSEFKMTRISAQLLN